MTGLPSFNRMRIARIRSTGDSMIMAIRERMMSSVRLMKVLYIFLGTSDE